MILWEIGLLLLFCLLDIVCLIVEEFYYTSLSHKTFVPDSKYSTGDIATAQQLSRLLLLTSDAAIATRSSEVKVSSLTFATDTAVSVINSINSHAYMSPHKADKAIQLMVLLVKDLGLNGIEEPFK